MSEDFKVSKQCIEVVSLGMRKKIIITVIILFVHLQVASQNATDE